MECRKDLLLRKCITKSHSGLITTFLYSIYEWREELQNQFDINTKDGELSFILWWIKWGKSNYPDVSVDYGISSKFVEEYINNVNWYKKYPFRLPPLSECLYSNESEHEVSSYKFINKLFQDEYLSLIKEDNSFNILLVKKIANWTKNNKERVEPNILNTFFNKLKEIEIIDDNFIDDVYKYKETELKSDLIEEKDNKSHSGLITTFLYSIYEWREELQNQFDINTKDGELSFILWWIKWGKSSYPDVSVDYGISSKFLFKHVYYNYFKKSKLPCLYNLFITSNTYNKMNEVELIFWLFKFGYIELINNHKDSLFIKILISESKSWLNKNNELLFDNMFDISNKEDDCVVTIIGKHKLDIGIGYDAKLIKKSLNLASLPSQAYEDNEAKITPINIFTMPAPDALVELTHIREERLCYSLNILSCPWELPYWPESLDFLLDFFDFIWVHSDYVYKSIPERYLKKVTKIPLPVEVHFPLDPQTINKKKFTVLTAFDLASTLSRKNPYGSIDAFIKAFGNNSDTELILKVNNGDLHKKRLLNLVSYVKYHNNITIVDKHLKIEELHELYASTDCFISLHRSEGFGRNIAEMMLLKKPVIVTSFSGNMDFTLESNSYLVPFEKVYLNPKDYIFSKNQYWAEPDINYASKILVNIFNNGIEDKKIDNAYELMSEKYSLYNSGITMYEILKGYYED